LQALEQIASLRTVAGEGWTEHVDDGKMLALLTACGSSDRPLDLAVVLRELERRGRHMPCAVLPTEPNSAGRPVSALTSWLQLPDGNEQPSKLGKDSAIGGACLSHAAGCVFVHTCAPPFSALCVPTPPIALACMLLQSTAS
jgi:hypothetical protein